MRLPYLTESALDLIEELSLLLGGMLIVFAYLFFMVYVGERILDLGIAESLTLTILVLINGCALIAVGAIAHYVQHR
ncbi:hypothetical protein [Halosegnis longus]|uniref:hypothetical protein n=1 Tax=Halosegnis longus TaxID=2216012 RepID=UPI00129DA5A3|nr:hypothetical protein [Halosegnis longus]